MNEKEISKIYDEFMNSQVKDLKSLFLKWKAQYGLNPASIYDLLEKEAIKRNDQNIFPNKKEIFINLGCDFIPKIDRIIENSKYNEICHTAYYNDLNEYAKDLSLYLDLFPERRLEIADLSQRLHSDSYDSIFTLTNNITSTYPSYIVKFKEILLLNEQDRINAIKKMNYYLSAGYFSFEKSIDLFEKRYKNASRYVVVLREIYNEAIKKNNKTPRRTTYVNAKLFRKEDISEEEKLAKKRIIDNIYVSELSIIDYIETYGNITIPEIIDAIKVCGNSPIVNEIINRKSICLNKIYTIVNKIQNGEITSLQELSNYTIMQATDVIYLTKSLGIYESKIANFFIKNNMTKELSLIKGTRKITFQ